MIRFRSRAQTAVALFLAVLWLAGDLAVPLLAKRGLEPGRVGRLGRPGRVGDPDVRVNARNVHVDRDVHVHGRRPVVYHDHDDWWDDDDEGEAALLGLVGGLVIGAMVAKPPKNAQPTNVGGQQYYYSDGTYYQPTGGQYQVVSPPLGVEVDRIPAGAHKFEIGDVTYFVAGEVYYRVYYRGADPVFQVVNNPLR